MFLAVELGVKASATEQQNVNCYFNFIFQRKCWALTQLFGCQTMAI